MAKIYKGDIGTIFRVDTGSDLTSSTLVQIKFKKPSAAILTKTATIETPPGTDGIIYYQIASGDLDESGVWYAQAYVEYSTNHWLGETFTFTVYEAYD